MNIDMSQYLLEVSKEKNDHPYLRYGQVLFNVLYVHWPDIANQVRGTASDPFYFDKGEEIERFFIWLAQFQE